MGIKNYEGAKFRTPAKNAMVKSAHLFLKLKQVQQNLHANNHMKNFLLRSQSVFMTNLKNDKYLF